jgi:hypothetical protein
VKIRIRIWDGTEFADQEIDALPTETPGLVIHRAFDGVGLVLSHEGTGLKTAVFPDEIFWCAQALGELGDWTAEPDKELIARARDVISAYKAVPGNCSAPQEAIVAEWARAGMPVHAEDEISSGGPVIPAAADREGDHSRPQTGSTTNGAAQDGASGAGAEAEAKAGMPS